MNKSLLQLMVKIADTRSFTQAGKELNMTQPAVSKAVNGLETELGVTLLIRNRRRGVRNSTPFHYTKKKCMLC